MTASPARDQLAWVVAALQAVTPPSADEIEDRFHAGFLGAVPVQTVIDVFTHTGDADLEVTGVDDRSPTALVARTTGGFLVELTVDAIEPHRIIGLMLRPEDAEAVDDPRLADPPATVEGATGPVAATVRREFEERGLVGLLLRGYRGGVDGVEVTAAIGWADLESGEAVTAEHRFAAYSVTKLLTSVAILRLVAADRLVLDSPVNAVLTSYRLSADDVTIRELLTHTGGVDSMFPHFLAEVPPTAELLGPVLEVDESSRGRHVYSNGGYATLGQVITDVSGRSYDRFVTEEVLRPLGMTSSDFPMAPPWPAPGLASGHDTADGGLHIVPTPPTICTVPSAGGLWSTADDLARFAFGWPSLLPDELVVEALRPQADRGSGHIGLGFLLVGTGGETLWGHAGGGLGYQSSLLCRPSAGLVAVGFTNRMVPVEPLAAIVLDGMAAARVG